LIVPLVAALSAALFAHVAIDVAGDYLLPHDTYDDIAHGSRTLVLGGVAAMLVLLASIALSAAIREARGSIDAFRKVVLSCLDLELRWMFVLTAICATITLIAMEGIDVHAAGGAIDDPGDLFGGSIILGAACVAFFAVLSTFGIRALACAIAGAGRALVRALASVFATRSRPRIVKRRPHEASVCALQPSRRFGTALSGRAPPPALRFRPLF
jgi:hypothetical protein